MVVQGRGHPFEKSVSLFSCALLLRHLQSANGVAHRLTGGATRVSVAGTRSDACWGRLRYAPPAPATTRINGSANIELGTKTGVRSVRYRAAPARKWSGERTSS